MDLLPKPSTECDLDSPSLTVADHPPSDLMTSSVMSASFPSPRIIVLLFVLDELKPTVTAIIIAAMAAITRTFFAII
jgi:hypothetical protein